MLGVKAGFLVAAVLGVAVLAGVPARADEAGARDEAGAEVPSAQALAGVLGGVTVVDVGWAGGVRGDAGAHGLVLDVGWRWHQLALAVTVQHLAAEGDRDALYLVAAGAAVPVSSRWSFRADGVGGFFAWTTDGLRPALGVRVGVERAMGWRSVPLDTLALTVTVAGDVGGASAEAEGAGRVVAVVALTVGKVLKGPRPPSAREPPPATEDAGGTRR
jgi:hypothetical protein